MTYGMVSPVGAGEAQALDALDAFSRDAVPDAVREWIQDLRAAIAEGRLAAQELSDRLESLAHRATTLAHEMDFARDVAHRVLYMDQGVIYEEGTPEQIAQHRQSHTGRFLKPLLP